MDNQEYRTRIRAFYRRHTRMPSYSELTAVVGFRSKHAAHHLVQRLVADEWIEKDAAGTLLPGRLFHTVPLLGTVTAGFPSPAEEELADTMTLDEYLITIDVQVCFWKSRRPVGVPSRFLCSSAQTGLTPCQDV